MSTVQNFVLNYLQCFKTCKFFSISDAVDFLLQKVNILGTVKRTNLAYTLLSEENSRKILSKR